MQVNQTVFVIAVSDFVWDFGLQYSSFPGFPVAH
jgi:hypothetical protein